MNIYLTRQEIFEKEILPWVNEHMENIIEYSKSIKNDVTFRLNDLIIEDFDEILDGMMFYNRQLEQYSKDENTSETKTLLTENEVGLIGTNIQKTGWIYVEVRQRIIDLYGKRKD